MDRDLSPPVVCIIGRPNVGKSSLFNRLVKRRQALVDATPGSTRDRLYAQVEWRGVSFVLTDTGGLQFNRKDRLSQAIQTQVARAIEEASCALFVCDAREGVMPLDSQVAGWVRRWGKPVLLVANKVESEKDKQSAHEFSALGLGLPRAASGLHGLGVGELLDAIVDTLKTTSRARPSESNSPFRCPAPDTLKVAIVGRPNVGKSSLLNRILGSERVLVDDVAGTTRDPVEATFLYRDRTYCLVDTAGIRSQHRLTTKIDAVARLMALEVIQRADVCLNLIDGSVGLVQEDLKLLSKVVSAGKPLCVVVNKWDLAPPAADCKQAAFTIAQRAPFVRWAPVICTSAKTGLHALDLLSLAARIHQQASRRIEPAQLRRVLEMIQNDPKAPAGIRNARLFRLIQASVVPSSFHLLARVKGALRNSDLAYLERIVRHEFQLEGTPVLIRMLTLKARVGR